MITGPSGVGKGTLISRLRDEVPGIDLSVSATTREPREGERDGEHYHFMDPDEFDRRVAAGDFLEHADYASNRYGTLRSEVEPRLARGGQRGAGDRGPGRPAGPAHDARRRSGVHRAALAGDAP